METYDLRPLAVALSNARRRPVVIVDDEPMGLDLLRCELECSGIQAICCRSPGYAIQMLKENPGALLVIDWFLQERKTGLELVVVPAVERGWRGDVLWVSAWPERATAEIGGEAMVVDKFDRDALQREIIACTLPVEVAGDEQLYKTVQRLLKACEAHRREEETRRLQQESAE